MVSETEICKIEIESDVTLPGLRDVYRLWRTSKGDALYPASVDLLAMPEMINSSIIFDLKDPGDPLNAKVSFVGTSMSKGAGFELTGRRLKGLVEAPNIQRMVIAAATRAEPLVLGPIPVHFKPHSFLNVQHMSLPLSSDGKTLTRILYAGESV